MWKCIVITGAVYNVLDPLILCAAVAEHRLKQSLSMSVQTFMYFNGGLLAFHRTGYGLAADLTQSAQFARLIDHSSKIALLTPWYLWLV